MKNYHDIIIVEPNGTIKIVYDPNTPERRAARLAKIGMSE